MYVTFHQKRKRWLWMSRRDLHLLGKDQKRMKVKQRITAPHLFNITLFNKDTWPLVVYFVYPI